MKRFLIGLLVVALGVGTGLTITAAKYQAKIRPNTRVGIVPVGGLLPDEAAKRVRIWWESERVQPIKLTVGGREVPLQPSLTTLGVAVDDVARVKDLPTEDFVEATTAAVTRPDFAAQTFPPKYKTLMTDHAALAKAVRQLMGPVSPAKVSFEKGVVIRTPEVASFTLDKDAISGLVIALLESQGPRELELPVREAPKQIPDEQLNEITEVVASYTTNYNARMTARSSNLRLASQKLNGVILRPGQRLSFNETVGERTVRDGYQEAGIYVNGRHETGLAGGICQVSTTLYNAALYANLKIVRRTNHSMPVPYVPLGRDATVNWGRQDLVFENNTDRLMAISSECKGGRLTFRILGQKTPGLEVKMVQEGHRSWDVPMKVVPDPRLPVGKRVVVEKGSRGHSVQSYRLVYQDGQLIAREPLGRSHYSGGARIIAVGGAKPDGSGAATADSSNE